MKKGVGIGLSIFGGIFLSIGILVGVVFIIIGSVMNKSVDKYNTELKSFKRDAVEVKGKVTEGGDGYTTVRYEDEDGYEYEVSYSMSSSELLPGKKVTVYYDEDDPEICMIPDVEAGVSEMLGKIFGIIGGIIAGIFGGIGLVMLIIGIVTAKSGKKAAAKAAAVVDQAASGYENAYGAVSAGTNINGVNIGGAGVSANYSGAINLNGSNMGANQQNSVPGAQNVIGPNGAGPNGIGPNGNFEMPYNGNITNNSQS